MLSYLDKVDETARSKRSETIASSKAAQDAKQEKPRPGFGIIDVLSSDICIGCGACSIIENRKINICMTDKGIYQADVAAVQALDPVEVEYLNRICPFSDFAKNEDDLAAPEQQRSSADYQQDFRVGNYLALLAGRINDTSLIEESSSGGLTSWLTSELFDRNLIRGLIHVGASSDDHRLFQYSISYSNEEARHKKKSIYYPVTMADVLKDVLEERRGPYALVGIPCYIKAARLLCLENPKLANLIRYFIGIICGHMKSSFFAEASAWELGIHPADIEAVDFRKKVKDKGAHQYNFYAETKLDGSSQMKRAGSLTAGNWGHGAFQPNACNYCDDVFAETADIVFGDAWLPQYKDDWRGTNIIVSRNEELTLILREGLIANSIQLEELSLEDTIRSQAGGLRHRRSGLSVRLANDIANGFVPPQKRVEPSISGTPTSRIRLIEQRRRMSSVSIESFIKAKAEGDFSIFQKAMRSEQAVYSYMNKHQYPDLEKNIYHDVALFGWHHQTNLGGCLTFYALHQLLRKAGLSVVVVWKPGSTKITSGNKANYEINKQYYKYTKPRELDRLHELRAYCRNFVVASDQLWHGKWGPPQFEYELLGCGDSSVKKISVATSFGGESSNLPFYGEDRPIVKYLLSSFNSISVREQNGVEILSSLGISSTKILDPVFLAPQDAYESLASKSKLTLNQEFVLGYILDPTKDIIRYTRDVLPKVIGCSDHLFLTSMSGGNNQQSQIDIWNSYGSLNLALYASYADLVRAVQRCSCMVTTSYHGACLATIFEKPFVCIPPSKRGNSRFGLFDELGLGSRIVRTNDFADDLFSQHIDWDQVGIKLNHLKSFSFDWLSDAFSSPISNC